MSALPEQMDEASFLRIVRTQAMARGWYVAHFKPSLINGRWATHMVGKPGFPDLVLAKEETVLFRELKTNTGRLSPEQREWLAHLGNLGGVWRPRDYPLIITELEAA